MARKRTQLEPYEHFLQINGGQERCGICGRKPKNRRLDRDHDHRTMKARGLLCHADNRLLTTRVTPDWCDKAKAYLERTS